MTRHLAPEEGRDLVSDDEDSALAQGFEAERRRLHSLAFGMLGSHVEAEDAVQEAWMRLSRTNTEEIVNLGAWLRTVVSRICLDVLRTRVARPEDPLFDELVERSDSSDPAADAVMADSIGAALLVVLDALTPAERLAFVLHDVFAIPFDEVAAILGRSPDATKQLASRGRRRVRGVSVGRPNDLNKHRELVAAFLAAARNGDLDQLVGLLHADCVVRADEAAVQMGSAPRVRGAQQVAETFLGRAQAARPALVGGTAGAAWFAGGSARVAFDFRFLGDQIVSIDLLADQSRLATVVSMPPD